MTANPATQDETSEGFGGDDDPLLECLAIVTRLHGDPRTVDAIASGLPVSGEPVSPALFVRAADAIGYSARVIRRSLRRMPQLALPAVLLLKDGGACVLVKLPGDGTAEVLMPESGAGARTLPVDELRALYGGYCIFVHPRLKSDIRAEDEAVSRTRFWFWGALWRFRTYYAETVLAALLINVLALAASLFVMNVYDRVVPNSAVETLWVLATGTAIAMGFEFLARMLRGYLLDAVGRKVDVLLSSRLFQQALAIRLEARPASAGAQASNLRDFEAVRDFFTSATLTTLTDIPFIFLFTWIISLIGGPIAWVPLLAVPVLLFVGLLAQIPLAMEMRRHVRESSAKHGVLIEAVEGIETIKALRAEGSLQRKWEDYTALTAQSASRSRFISSLVVNFAMLAQQFVTVGMVVWGVYLIAEGRLTVGALVACTILSGRALAPLSQLANLLTRYQHSRAALQALDKFMHLPTERPAGKTFLHRPGLEGAIEFAGASFAYPGQKSPVLQDVSFRVASGERVAILGRVGSGKSTTLRLAAGLYQPQSGSVLIDGTDIQQIDPSDVRRAVGLLGQDVRLFLGTLRENLALGAPLADDEAILAALRVAGLDRFVASHPRGLDLQIGERGEGVSGGQKQAIAIARLLLAAPPVLLLDEPTASMDHTTEQNFMAHFRNFVRGRTLILATHKPAMLDLVDRLIVVDAGRVVADGPRDVVLKALTKPSGPGTPT